MTSRVRNLIAIFILITTVSVLARISTGTTPQQNGCAPNMAAADNDPPGDHTEACRQNLKNIATALEMYASDYNGNYPYSLSQLVPQYFKSIPHCPAAGSDTYTAGYATGRDAVQDEHLSQDYYYLACNGHHHPEYQANLPAFDCALGLLPQLPYNGTPQGGRDACSNELKKIATAMELYSTDHEGNYPAELSQLVPNYLPATPTCPVNLKDPYILESGAASLHNDKKFPQYYYLTCSGTHPGGSPAYDSTVGLRN